MSGSGRKGRGDSRSQGRKVTTMDHSSQNRKDSSLNGRKNNAKQQPVIKTREEIELETR